MHVWDNFDLIREYRESDGIEDVCRKIMEIGREGQTFEI